MEDNVAKITSKILEDAHRKSDEIIDAAELEANEKLETMRRKGEAAEKRLIDEAAKEAEQTRRKIIAESTIKARTIILESKERLIQQAFTKAEEQIEVIHKDKKYPTILVSLAVDTCLQMGGGGLELVVRDEDKGLIKKELKQIEKEVSKGAGKASKLRVTTGEIGPGLIVKSGNGRIGIDSTFRNRLELLRPLLRLKVAEVLFQ